MDIEKLIEQLHNFEACAYGYHINGEVLGVDCSDFEQVMVDAAEEISKIPTLQAENEKLREMYQKEKSVCHAVQAELEQVLPVPAAQAVYRHFHPQEGGTACASSQEPPEASR